MFLSSSLSVRMLNLFLCEQGGRRATCTSRLLLAPCLFLISFSHRTGLLSLTACLMPALLCVA